MRQLIISYGQPARVVEVPAPQLKPGCILVRTAFSAVSVGTERVAAGYGYMNIAQKSRSRPDQVKKVLESLRRNGMKATLSRVRGGLQKWSATGYSCSGIVVAVGPGVHEFHEGDQVACAGGGYAVHAQYCLVPRRLAVRVPEGVDLSHAAFAAIGSIAIHAFRLGEVGLCDRVAVIGLGIVGQLLCQIGRAAGNEVVALDIDAERLALARENGAASSVLLGKGDEREHGIRLSKSRGFDAVCIAAATPSSEPARLAAALAKDRGRLIVVGDVGLNLDRQSLYEKELIVRVSRSYGPGRYDSSYEEGGIDYPYGFVRWTEQRNMESFVELLRRGSIQMDRLIHHRYSIDDAAKAFELIVKPEGKPPLGVVLEYPRESEASPSIVLDKKKGKVEYRKRLGLGLIGPGSFARTVLLPALVKAGVRPVVVAGTNGVSTGDVGKQFSFELATTEIAEVLGNTNVDVVAITTRHGSHAQLVVKSLEAGKAVFVEKPLATTPEALERVCEAYNANPGFLMVGFNRRFAPFAQKVKSFVGDVRGPLMIHIRVNAGPMPKNHWTLSSNEGGGRIIGEACHFIDLIQYFAGCPIVKVYARAISGDGEDLEDNVSATFSLADGSSATLLYTGLGDTMLPKEYIEVFCDGKVAVVDDFRQMKTIHKGKITTEKSRQDKGFDQEVRAFCTRLTTGSDCPIPFGELLNSSLATFAVIESCRTGKSVSVRSVERSSLCM